jgi:putative ABC transport system permease protein
MAISIRESVAVGLTDFWSRKVRSFVTVLGIVLGTMSVMVVLSMVDAVNRRTTEWMTQRGGLNRVSIQRNWEYNKQTSLKRHLTYKELRLVQSLVPEADVFNPTMNSWSRMTYGKGEFTGQVLGVFPDFTKVEEWVPDKGRFLNRVDLDESSDVIVIGSTVATELFGSRNPIGQFITVENRRLQIIGIMKTRYYKNDEGGEMFGDNALEYMNRQTFIPLSTMIHKMSENDEIDEVELKAKTPDEAVALRQKVEAILLNLRQGEAIFRVESAQEEAKSMAKNMAVFSTVFVMISTISLFVGGIVITNIMLATIKERTREIGVRMAVGARRRDVFMQFLVQTVLITTIGGLIGVAVGASILHIVGSYIKMDITANGMMIFEAVLISSGVGLIFGILPAIHACNLNPVDALRQDF